jgi:hypothetical protein
VHWPAKPRSPTGTYVSLAIVLLEKLLAADPLEIFLFDTRFSVLLAMGCLSLLLSLTFYMKSRLFRAVSESLTVDVFDKSFNVFKVDTQSRRMIRAVPLFLIVELVVPFVLSYWMFKYVGMVLASGLILFLCLGLLMIDTAAEILSHANTFEKAFRKDAKLGRGDLVGVFFLEETMPKLTVYYLLLATVFFASFIAAPYLSPLIISFLSHVVDAAVSVTIGISPLLMIVPVGILAFAIGAAAIFFIGGIIKSKVFNFAPSAPFTAVEEQFERGVRFFELGECPYYEMDHRPLLEDQETEERKRRGLAEKKRLG